MGPQIYRVYEIQGDTLIPIREEEFKLKKEHQIGNFAQFCNECGNCDTFCPEYGGPYIEKPTFFSTLEDWKASSRYDGFVLVHTEARDQIWGRIKGVEYSLTVPTPKLAGTAFPIFETPIGKFAVAPDTLEPQVLELRHREGTLDMGIYLMFLALLRGVLYGTDVNYVNASYPDIV